jgi:hypothetical protein
MCVLVAVNEIASGLVENLCNVNKDHVDHLIHGLCEKLALIEADDDIPNSTFERHFEELKEMVGSDPHFDAAEAEDGRQRSLLKIAEGHGASSQLSQGIRKMVLFLECYNIRRGPPAHKSATCVVAFGEHYRIADSIRVNFSMLGSTAAHPVVTPVAMKFMKSQGQFERELLMRKQFKLKSEFVIQPHTFEETTLSYDSLTDSKFKEETTSYNFNKVLQLLTGDQVVPFGTRYPFLIVFPRAIMGLNELITHGHIAGQTDRVSTVKDIMEQIVKALLHFHEQGIIHAVGNAYDALHHVCAYAHRVPLWYPRHVCAHAHRVPFWYPQHVCAYTHHVPL